METPAIPDIPIPAEVAPAIREIAGGMALQKCRRCGCMAEALNLASRAFAGSDAPALRSLLPFISEQQSRMEPIAYDCLGCRKCWGADATVMLAERCEEVNAEQCRAGSAPKPADAPLVRLTDPALAPWPPYPGDYLLGAPCGSVAVCTLSSRELVAQVIAAGDPSIAIAGRCDTENIGVEKVVLNVIANPLLRWLVLCGEEARGHRTGDAFLHLIEHGVDANMRVLEAASWRAVLKNLTLRDVARFREQVQIVNRIGVTDPERIVEAARAAAALPVPPLAERAGGAPLEYERIRAGAPERLRLDPKGFFVVLPQADGTILLEHYENNGRLAHVIEGRQAAVIAATAVERGLCSRLDHAAYLGRELAKAEMAIQMGVPYEQDAALGNLLADTPSETTSAKRHSGAACGRG